MLLHCFVVLLLSGVASRSFPSSQPIDAREECCADPVTHRRSFQALADLQASIQEGVASTTEAVSQAISESGIDDELAKAQSTAVAATRAAVSQASNVAADVATGVSEAAAQAQAQAQEAIEQFVKSETEDLRARVVALEAENARLKARDFAPTAEQCAVMKAACVAFSEA